MDGTGRRRLAGRGREKGGWAGPEEGSGWAGPEEGSGSIGAIMNCIEKANWRFNEGTCKRGNHTRVSLQHCDLKTLLSNFQKEFSTFL